MGADVVVNRGSGVRLLEVVFAWRSLWRVAVRCRSGEIREGQGDPAAPSTPHPTSSPKLLHRRVLTALMPRAQADKLVAALPQTATWPVVIDRSLSDHAICHPVSDS